MTVREGNLVWLDLEMTGLDVDTQVILQVALVITNANLEILQEWESPIWQPERAMTNMSPFVRDMHDENGLLDRVAACRTDLADAEKSLLGIISRWCPMGAPLCGNSIWQDRKFVDKYMPAVGRYLGYRMVDVSSLKVLASLWYGAEAVFKKPAAGAHDALVDIKNSIDELAHYRKLLFLTNQA